mmetsp:Transcript_18037/g.43351  ORF Transcript_18037/g.43351 Transcript_18037/m.43351 type:complete len:288 (+) Transcript_18037:1398-2261(+)
MTLLPIRQTVALEQHIEKVGSVGGMRREVRIRPGRGHSLGMGRGRAVPHESDGGYVREVGIGHSPEPERQRCGRFRALLPPPCGRSGAVGRDNETVRHPSIVDATGPARRPSSHRMTQRHDGRTVAAPVVVVGEGEAAVSSLRQRTTRGRATGRVRGHRRRPSRSGRCRRDGIHGAMEAGETGTWGEVVVPINVGQGDASVGQELPRHGIIFLRAVVDTPRRDADPSVVVPRLCPLWLCHDGDAPAANGVLAGVAPHAAACALAVRAITLPGHDDETMELAWKQQRA